MLEESAAQLAALRQRAEYLLEQLAAGREPVPGAPVLNEDRHTQPGAVAPTVSHAPDTGPPTNPDGGPTTALSQDRLAPSQALDQPPTPAESSVHRADDHGSPPPSPQQDIPHNAELTPAHFEPSQPALDETRPPETQQEHAPLSDSQSQSYPLQKSQHPPHSQSLLDTPVTAAPSLDWSQVQVGPETTPTDVHMIEEEIISLYQAIDHVRETRRENTGHALALLREAREIIAGHPYRIERAQYNIEQAKQIIDRARFSRSRSRGIALRTFLLLILWLSGLGGLAAVLYLYPLRVNETVSWISTNTGWNTSHYASILWTVSAGGIGGCLGTVSFLFERMRVHEEFDRQYIVRSTIQPLMGILLGLVSYALLASLFNSLDASIIGHPVTAFLPAAIALPIGIWQVYVYALIFRFTRLFTFQRRRRW